MMTALIGLLLRAGLPERFAKPVLYALFGLIVFAGLGIAKCSYDKSIIEADRNKSNAEAQKKAREADTMARKAVQDAETDINQETEDAKANSDNCDDVLKCFADELRP